MGSFFRKLVSPLGLVVVVCFFLPWITVSCNGVALVERVSAASIAQGIQLQGQPTEGTPELYLVAAGGGLMVLAGLMLLVRHSLVASTLALLGALVAATVTGLFYTRALAELEQNPSAAGLLRVTWEPGFWSAAGAAAGGTLSAFLSFFRR